MPYRGCRKNAVTNFNIASFESGRDWILYPGYPFYIPYFFNTYKKNLNKIGKLNLCDLIFLFKIY